MDQTTSILLGIAGTGIMLTMGYGIYQGRRNSQSVTGSRIDRNVEQSGKSQNRHEVHINKGDIVKWQEKYDVKFLKNDRVLYNALDSLSVYGHADEEIFLDVVHFVEQFCILYDRAQRPPKKYTLIDGSTKIQMKLFNVIGALERVVSQRYPIGQQKKIMDDFQDRSQLVVDILNGYHINIIREMNST